MRYDHYIDCPLRELSGNAARSAAEYLHDALVATKHLNEDHEGLDRSAIVVALIRAASEQEAAAMRLIGVQQTIEAVIEQCTPTPVANGSVHGSPDPLAHASVGISSSEAAA